MDLTIVALYTICDDFNLNRAAQQALNNSLDKGINLGLYTKFLSQTHVHV